MKWRSSFKTKNLVLRIGVSLIAMSLLGVESYQSAVAFRSGKEAILKAASNSLMDKIDRNLFERYGDVQAFALSESARSGDATRIREFMNDMMTTYAPIYDLMIMTDATGKVVAVSTKDKNGKNILSQSLIGTDYSKKIWFKQAINDKIPSGSSFVEDLHIDEDTAVIVGNEGRVMNFTAPIRDKQTGTILGVWTNRMSWPDVVETIAKEEAEKIRNEQVETSIAYLIDNKGTYLLHPESKEYELKKNYEPAAGKSSLAENAIREVEVTTPQFNGLVLESKAKSRGYSAYQGRGWSAIVQVPYYDAQTRMNNQVTALAFFLIIMANILAFFVLHRLTGQIEDVVERMADESSQVKLAANQVSIVSQQLSESTTEQAAAIEETAASMEEITGMLTHTTQNAGQCRVLSEEGQAEAQKGKQVISKMSAAMEDIATANNKLDRLVKVIDDIGNKTKIINDIVSETRLLSFNASIEAARAGVHGKGFAVVAEEVGKLASISGKAADEIHVLLNSSVKEVTEVVKETQERVHLGKSISQECEMTFGNMGEALERVNELIKTIAVASKDQELGIKQVTRAIGEMDKVTQSNSHNAELLSDQSNSLHNRAESLNGSIDIIQEIVSGVAQEAPSPSAESSKSFHPMPKRNQNVRSSSLEKSMESTGTRSDSRWKKMA